MNNKIKYIPILICCFLIINHANSQSIEALLLISIENDLEIKIHENDYQSVLKKIPQVSQYPDPELGVGVFPLPVQTRLGPQIMRLSATQMFPWFGTLDGREDLENAKAQALREKMNIRALDLAYRLKLPYFKLYELRESQSIIQKNLQLLESLEKLALAKVESGRTSASDVLRVQLKREELLQKINIIQSKEQQSTIAINELLNRALDIPIQIIEKYDFAILAYQKDSLISNISQHHPMLKMYALQQDISKKAMTLNTLSSKPSFGVGMDYIMVGKRNDAVVSKNGRDIIQLRASIKIPIQKKKYKAKQEEEELKILGLEMRKENLMNQFKAEIEQGYAEFKTARITRDGYDTQIRLIKSTINILEAEYSASGKNFDELLRLEMELIGYELKIFKAIVESHFAKNRIERFIVQ
ncbi:MAG: outer membrane protein TolC [Maribacter sp.]|jgi:outer membrane protein TolC